MVLRHIGAHHDDAVGIVHAPWVESRRAAAEPGPQTGDAGAVSYPCLVFDRDHPQAAHQLLADVIEFNLEGGAAQRKDRRRHVDEFVVGKLFDESVIARFLCELGNPGHRALEIPDFPIDRPRCAMQNLRRPVGIDVELKDSRALRTKRSFVVRTPRVAFDIDDLSVHRMHEGCASDRTVRTKTRRRLRAFDSQLLRSRHSGPEIYTRTDQAAQRCTGAGSN